MIADKMTAMLRRPMRAWAAGAGTLLFATLCATLSIPAAGQGERSLERGVKAAFLYKFAGYVEWPAGALPAADAPIVIAVAQEAALADELERIVPGRRIDNHPIVVRRLREGDSLAGIQILFIGAGDRGRTASLVRAAQPHPLLVVTEIDNGLALGSGINFVLHEGRVRFEASPEAVERSGLKLSSRLLSVASNARMGTAQ